MKTLELLTYLRERDIALRLDGEQLLIDAPANALTAELRERLVSRKAEIVTFLRDSARAASTESTRIERAPRDGNLPLSHAQERLWFLDQLESGSPAYVMPSATLLRGDLDIKALELSLTEIVRRHEALRTVFESHRGSPRQVIRDPVPVTVSVTDLSGLPADERQREGERLVVANSRATFDLANGPLMRARLLKLRPNEHVFLIAFHHIVFDGWSAGIFAREFAALYRAFRAGEPSPLAEPALQYLDFAQWQRRQLDSGSREVHLEYWTRQLSGFPTLQLPADRPRPPMQTESGASCSSTLSADSTSALKAFSRKENVTLSMTMLAAFNTLLHRLSGQDDIVIGTPVAGRNRAESENVIGFFINTVVLRSRLTRDMSFRVLLQQVRQMTAVSYAHQEMPFEELVSLLVPHRDLSRTPIFQVFFNHVNLEEITLNLPGISAQPLGQSLPRSKFDLTLYVHEQGDRVRLHMVYNPELFDERRMKVMLEQYGVLLEALVEDPDISIDRYSLLTESTRPVLPDPTVSLSSELAGPVGNLLCRGLADHGERIALASADGDWTYSLLDHRADQLARLLVRSGVRPGAVIGIFAQRDPLLICAMLGVLRSGAAFALLDPSYPDSRLAECWRTARASGLIRISGAGALGPGLSAAVGASNTALVLELSNSTFGELKNDTSVALPACEPDQLAYVAFTSGTTGTVKAILGTHVPVAHFLNWQKKAFDLRADDRFSLLSGISHDPLLRDVFAPLWVGATLHVPGATLMAEPARLANWMREERITVTHLTPALAKVLCMALGSSRTDDLRYAFLGGDSLTSSVVQRLRSVAPNVACVNFYGATETPQAMSYYVVKPDHHELREQIPIGRGIAEVQLLVLNERDMRAGVGELGQIVIRTPYLSRGYLGDAALTASRFTTNPLTGDGDTVYRTGDFGRYLPDGCVQFVGRRDDQVKVRGFRVELAEVESALRQHPAVAEAAALLRNSSDGEQRLVAYFVPAGSDVVGATDIREFLRPRLPHYAIPSACVSVRELPLSPNGKINKEALRSVEIDDQIVDRRPRRPHTALENQLLAIWEQVLEREDLSVSANFFELGGTSLTAVRLFAQLRRVFGKDLPLATLFQAPTIEKLAAALQSTGRFAPWKSLVAIQPSGSKPPIFMVPGVGGNVLEFARLASLLGHEQPFYGTQSRGLDGKEPPLRRIESMAREYISEIRDVQPHGPYLLGGACMGGVVAFEMAQQLLESGERVTLLALVDTPLTNSQNRKRYKPLFFLHPLAIVCQGIARHLKALSGKGLKGWWVGGVTMFDIVRQMIMQRDIYRGDRVILYQDVVTAANHEAMVSYVPQEYRGHLHMFVASERPVAHCTRLDWGNLAGGGFSVSRINARDSGELLRPPYVNELASKLGEALNGIDRVHEPR